MNLDQFLDRQYNRTSYNCGHFVCEVWQYLTGEDIRYKILPLIDCMDNKNRNPIFARRDFKPLQKPVSPCIVLMRSPQQELHVGVYYQGSVIHIREDSCVENLAAPIATRFSQRVRYYL